MSCRQVPPLFLAVTHFRPVIAKPRSRGRMDVQVFDKADFVVKRNGCSYVEQTA